MRDLAAQQTAFSGLAAATSFTPSVIGGALAESVSGEAVNGDYFRTFELTPTLGRLLSPDDDRPGAAPVAVLSYSLWRLRFGADPGVIGRVVIIDRAPVEVVGVAPAAFHGWDFGNVTRPTAVWVPIATAPGEVRDRLATGNRQFRWLAVKARLAPEHTRSQADSEVTAIGRRLEAAFPGPIPPGRERDAARAGRIWHVYPVRDRARAGLSGIGTLFVAGVSLVLLVGCLTLANLALARGSVRQHEIGVRRALGASRGRLIREHLVESALVASAAGLVALPVVRALTQRLTGEIPAVPNALVLLEPRLDVAALVAGAVAAVATLTIVGLWPALQLTRVSIRGFLASGGGTTAPRWRMHRRLIGWQVAGSVALLLVATGCVDYIVRHYWGGSGVDADRLALVRVDYDDNGYGEARRAAAIDATLARLRQRPEIEDAAATAALPFGDVIRRVEVSPAGGPAAPGPAAQVVAATSDILRTLGIRVRRGRTFGEQDRGGSPPVALVDETLARTLFGSAAAIGREIRLSQSPPGTGAAASRDVEVVGVVSDTDAVSLGSRKDAVVYVPLAQEPSASVTFVARASGDAGAALVTLQSTLRGMDADLVMARSGTGTMLLTGQSVVLGGLAALAAALGTFALLLTTIGLAGVLSHLVSGRRREIGVRVALGAERGRIVRLVLADGLRPVADGFALGLLIGIAGRIVLSAVLGQAIAPWDPVSLLTIPLLLTLAALVASYWPARRALDVPPSVTLRD